MADEGALATDGPEAAEPVEICGSVICDAEMDGGVAGMEGKLEALAISMDSANSDGVSRYD